MFIVLIQTYKNKMKTDQQNPSKVLLTALGAWVLTLATLLGSTYTIRQRVVVNTMRPAYAYATNDDDLWNRNDNENETVHLPTKFDIGLRIAAISGKK
jgi:hypothetical protein